MKAYLFVPTGEVRPPKKDEHYLDDDGGIEISHGKGCVEFPIIQRHEIDVPEGIRHLDVVAYPYLATSEGVNFLRIASILLTKPKVKKWKWECGNEGYGIIWRTTKPYSEEEMKQLYLNHIEDYHKIPETEIEGEVERCGIIG